MNGLRASRDARLTVGTVGEGLRLHYPVSVRRIGRMFILFSATSCNVKPPEASRAFFV